MEEEILKLIPSLRGKAEKSVRILPVTGNEPAANATKIGGQFLWSADESWLCCNTHEESLMDDCPREWNLNYELGVNTWDSKHNDNFVPILQIRAADVPQMHFPPETDPFQLLWCPRYHKPDYSPLCQIFWRKEEEVKILLKAMPEAKFPENELIPQPSAVLLQETIEYPSYWALMPEERALLTGTAAEFYFEHLSADQSIKISGHVHWIQRPEIPVCVCGQKMKRLLTVASSTYEDYPNRKTSGLHIGRTSSVYVFVCCKCRNSPFETVFQSG